MAAARNGLRLVNLHLYTDKAADVAAQIAEISAKEGGRSLAEIKRIGWGFDHGTFLDPKKAELFAKYGFWMAFQVRSIVNEERVLQVYGPEYAPWVLPVKAFEDAGARFTLNTDSHLMLGTSHEEMMQDKMVGGSLWGRWPDEFRNSIWPWLGVWITREIGGKVYSPQKKLDRTTVMKAWTIWPAEFLLREKDLGSLEPGKLADFIITDKDYFTIPEKEINGIKTLLTAIGGQVKFKASDF